MPRHADPDCQSGPFPRPPRATSGATGPGVVAAAARLPARIAALAALGLLGGAPANAAPAHTHGEATLDVAVEHDGFSVSLRVPMASLIGFEHRARSSAERKAAQEALAVLRQPATWLRADTAAACTVAAADVDADLAARLAPAPGPVVDPRRGTAVVKRVDAAAAAQQVAEPDGHADIEVDARWRCRAPAALRGADLALFEAFARLHRVTVQVAGPRGQGGQTLTRSARRLVLTR